MSIGGSVSLGGNLNLSGMNSITYPPADAAAAADYCTGGGPGNGNGPGSGNGPGNGEGSGSSCSIGGSGGAGNGNGIWGSGSFGDPNLSPDYFSADGGGGNNGGGGGGGNGGLVVASNQVLLGPGPVSGSSNGLQAVWLGTNAAEDLPCQPVSGPVPTCVAPQTRIALFPEGSKPASEVAVGDRVLTRTAEGELRGEAVTAVRVSVQPRLMVLTEDGHRLHCSHSHEVMVADAQQLQGQKKGVSRLTCADRLLTAEGVWVGLAGILPGVAGEVILLSLAGPHHLYLSDGLWSHNKVETFWQWPTPGPVTPPS